MAHQYKIGDKVRIKKREGNPRDYPCQFTDNMTRLEGEIFTIGEIYELDSSFNYKERKFYNGDNNYYLFTEDDTYCWHSSMFEPVSEDHEPTTSISFKEEDLLPICGMIGQIQCYEGSGHSVYYLYFDNINEQDHSICCAKLRELVPNFDKIADEYGSIRHESICFPEFSTISDLVKFTQAVNNAYNSKKSITTSKTLNENEIRFQKSKTLSVRGFVPTGRAICGRRCKTAIKLGHLSNTTCYC